jgi:hypothetical protein
MKIEAEKKISPKPSPVLGPTTVETTEKKVVRRRPKVSTENL